MTETRTVTITDDAGTEERIELPAELVDLIVPPELEMAEGIGDLIVFSCAQRIHAVRHHSEEEHEADLDDVETAIMDQFEDRFGATFGDVTGHQH